MTKTKAVAQLEAAIEQAGSQSALAKKLGVAPSLVTSWLRGGIPRYPTMVFLRNELKIPLDAWVQDVA